MLMKSAVIFPHMDVGVIVHDPANLAALNHAMNEHHIVVFLSHSSTENLAGTIGTLALIQKNDTTIHGAAQTLLRGLSRVRIEEILQAEDYTRARFTRIEEPTETESPAMQKVLSQINEFTQLIPGIPGEIINLLKNSETPSQLADLCAYSPQFTYEERLDLLQTLNPEERLQKISTLFQQQLNTLKEADQTNTIPKCETCADLTEQAFEATPNQTTAIITQLLTHITQQHTNELLTLLAEKYGPTFLMKHALR